MDVKYVIVNEVGVFVYFVSDVVCEEFFDFLVEECFVVSIVRRL